MPLTPSWVRMSQNTAPLDFKAYWNGLKPEVSILPELLSIAEKHVSRYFLPTVALSVSRIATRFLLERPGLPLISTPLPRLSRTQANDVAIRTAHGLLMNSLIPQPPQPGEVVVPSIQRHIGACNMAEFYFLQTILGLRHTIYRPTIGSQIIERNGLPVAIRKDYGEHSALTLQDIAIKRPSEDGYLHYPAGSIMRLELTRDNPIDKYTTGVLNVPDRHIARVDIQEVTGARFMRYSIWALPPGPQRAVFDPMLTHSIAGTEQRTYAQTTTIQELATIALRAMERL